MNSRRRPTHRGLVPFAVLALASTAAQAFVEPDAPRHTVNPSITASTPIPQRASSTPPTDRVAAWQDWSSAHPGWRANWNLNTGSLHRAYGPGVRLGIAGRLTRDNLEPACREFLAGTTALTGIRAEQLRLLKAESHLDRWYVVFEQVVDGVAIRGARADLRLGAHGEVVVWGADWFGTAPANAPAARVTQEVALATASSGLGAAIAVQHRQVLLPESGAGFRLAHELRFRTESPRGAWLALVDAQDGTLLGRSDENRYAEVTGNVSALVEPDTVGSTQLSLPLRDVRVNVGTGIEFGYTGVDGNFTITTTATDSVDLTSRLSGRFGRVYDYGDGFQTPTRIQRALPGSPRDFAWDDSNSEASERDAYYHAMEAHRFITELDPAFTAMDYNMPIVVDIYDRDCNAFYDGFGINFFGESMRCVNTARIADVVYHEYGHGVTDQQYRPLAPSGAMHEAFSDYMGCTMGNQPRLGRGFRGPGTIVRNLDNMRRYPDDLMGEVHRDGLILGGALWDLREALGPVITDRLWHFARYGAADTFDDYMLDVLVTDDDNADIYDGTPHFDAIVAAFALHGIGDYSVAITHAPLADTEDPNKPLTVSTTILSIFALEPPSLLLHYAVGAGPFNTLPLTPTGMGSRSFAATIPPQPVDTEVSYYVTAADTAGHIGSTPPGAPATAFHFRIGTDTTPPVIVHQPLGDRPLVAPSWPVRAQVTDNLDRGLDVVEVRWSRNARTLDQTTPMSLLGAPTWYATLPVGAASLGDSIFYALSATDSATAPNTALEPSAGLHAFRVVQGTASDFEATDGGLTPNGDWQWGVPAAPFTAYSGTNVWSNGLTANYSDVETSLLETPDIDLSTWSRAGLVFRHAYDAEDSYDGGVVELSFDGGAFWQLIVPSGDYPSQGVASLSGPGYSGKSNGWLPAEFDLTQWLGQTIRLRWRFASDSGITRRGWFLDDIEIVEAQVRSVPLDLQAESGRDSEALLQWRTPAGLPIAKAGGPLLGYHVYRASEPDFSDAVRVTPAPVPGNSYLDDGLVNGAFYRYAVTALYDVGESRISNLVTAQPFVAGYAAEVTMLDVVVPTAGAADTTITFTNTGTGTLGVNVWVGDPADTSLDAVRIAYHVTGATKAAPTPAASRWTLDEMLEGFRSGLSSKSRPTTPSYRSTPTPSGGEYQLLFTDGDDGTTPDFFQFQAREEGPLLYFRVNGHRTWGNILSDFNVLLGMDIDANRSTGDFNGADYYILMGVFAMNQIGVPAAIVTAGQQIVDIPAVQVFPDNADYFEVGFRSNLLGAGRVYLSLLALDPGLQVPRDFAPDPRAASQWMLPRPLRVAAPAGSPGALTITFPGAVPAGNYAGKLLLETNDPLVPAVTIPVTYDYSTPIAIQDLAAVQEGPDVVVRWVAADARDVAALRVYRADDGDAFAPVSGDLEVASGAQVFRDRDVAPGRHAYRIGEVDGRGEVTLHGWTEIDVVRAVPARTFLDPAAPNPFNPTTTLRFGLAHPSPAALVVFDARGRRVRTLLQASRLDAGFHRINWDGRDEAGRRVASGIYHARFEAAGQVLVQRLTLIK